VKRRSVTPASVRSFAFVRSAWIDLLDGEDAGAVDGDSQLRGTAAAHGGDVDALMVRRPEAV
jgi:hypothetical protein